MVVILSPKHFPSCLLCVDVSTVLALIPIGVCRGQNSFRTMTKCYLDLKHIYARILIANNGDFIRQSVCTAFIFTHTIGTLSACVQRNKIHLFFGRFFFFSPLILLCALFITFVYSFVWTMCEKRKRKRKRCFCT